ncbi:4Fe-4S binding protein [bacterium]|nr:4Fe-4S binding protein [candidate division CSSED10-310 bacterium]
MERDGSKRIQIGRDIAAAVAGYESARRLTGAHHRIARHYASPLLLGPRVSDDLLDLVMHMYTEEEAALVQHLPPFRSRTAEQVARLASRPPHEVSVVLNRLASVKTILLERGEPPKYAILPIVPGTFEMALMRPDASRFNSWHKRFAELFERLWDKGYFMRYAARGRAAVRYLPVGRAAGNLTMAWPSDHLEELLEPYDQFAVGLCQCRMAMELVGKSCGRPLENCVAIGPGSRGVISRGLMRPASRSEVLDIKRHAESQGLVSFMIDQVGDRDGNASCSCCGCCCHALRSISQFNTPGFIAAPHFIPVLEASLCTACDRCLRICPMTAWHRLNGALVFDRARCIGCGLCVTVCGVGALALEPVTAARRPAANTLSLLLQVAPAYLTVTAREWLHRVFRHDVRTHRPDPD